MNLLIIEDDKDTLTYLTQAFREEGFVVDSADDGIVGSQKARTSDYDLIILDNSLPRRSGREICRDVREAGKTARIMMLSVASDTMTKVELLDMGADDYVTKPFMWSELLARSRALLRRSEKKEEGVLEAGDIKLDCAAHIVTYKGKEIPLTPKEFALLQYLMKHRGRVQSRIKILEHVWDMNADPFTNTVETHILKLRRKFGATMSRPIIHTISGIGYKLP